MPKFLIVLLLGICPFLTTAQSTDVSAEMPSSKNVAQKGDFLLTYHVGMNSGIEHELRVERFFRSRWSLMYAASYTQYANPGNIEVRAPLGATVGVGLLSATVCGGYYGNDNFQMFLASCLIPDGIAWHTYFDHGFDVSPYVNWSGITFHINEAGNGSFEYRPSGGIRILKSLGKYVVLSAEQSVRLTSYHSLSSTSGIGLSVKF